MRPATHELFRLLQADRPSWKWTEETAELWDVGLAKFTDHELREGARIFLETVEAAPSLARLTKACLSARESIRAASLSPGASGAAYDDGFRGSFAHPDALLWLRFWPEPVPEEHRERYEAGCRASGIEPYYPPAGACGLSDVQVALDP